MRSPSGLPYHPHIQHATPESTYWYAEAVPEVMTLVAKRLDGLFGERS